jgi:hypothetical protein
LDDINIACGWEKSIRHGHPEVSALKVWRDCCHYMYLPRLVRDDVFKNAINLGLHSQDFFGFASGKSGDKLSHANSYFRFYNTSSSYN